MDSLLKDFRFAVRMLAQQPALALIAIVTFALGISLTATVFSIVNGALYRGLPFEQSGGHTWVATPGPRYAISEMTSPAHAPLRFCDLKSALDDDVAVIRQPIGEWTADWKKSSHNMEIRWPYAFVSAYEDGLQIINMRNPTKPRTVGFYDTYDEDTPYTGGGMANGVFGVDVRNADGLIVVSDMHSGF